MVEEEETSKYNTEEPFASMSTNIRMIVWRGNSKEPFATMSRGIKSSKETKPIRPIRKRLP